MIFLTLYNKPSRLHVDNKNKKAKYSTKDNNLISYLKYNKPFSKFI